MRLDQLGKDRLAAGDWGCRASGGQFLREASPHYGRGAEVLAHQETYGQAAPTPRRRRFEQEPCATSFGEEQVWRMSQALAEELALWTRRPLTKRHLYLVINARSDHVAEDGQVARDAALDVMGILDGGWVPRRCLVAAHDRGVGAAARRCMARAMCQQC